MKKKFGLIGNNVKNSFSKDYFDEKFFREDLRDFNYSLYHLNDINELASLLKETPNICGLNVTVPYKEQVIPLLDELDESAREIGAVNVINITDGRLKGYNTDAIAFLETIRKWYRGQQRNALVCGSGGSSKAVQYALRKANIAYHIVSREANHGDYTYEHLTNHTHLYDTHDLVINTTPLGMAPHVHTHVPIDFSHLSQKHFVYDLVYNPARTVFMQRAEVSGATVKNGLEMLQVQAEKSWGMWCPDLLAKS